MTEQSHATRAVSLLSEARKFVLDLCAEFDCAPGGDWQRLAERAFIEGRLAGVEWAYNEIAKQNRSALPAPEPQSVKA